MFRHRILTLLSAVAFAYAAHAAEAEDTSKVLPESPELAALVTPAPAGEPIPGITAETVRAAANKPQAAALLEWARAGLDKPIPLTLYTDYRAYRTKGERPPYEGPYFEKRTLLSRVVVLFLMTGDESILPRINDLIWSLCEESTWVAPAHEKQPWCIDLFCSETGAELCHICSLLGDRLPEEIRGRVAFEVQRRILDPYLEHGLEYWWNGGLNNWTGVCASAVGQCFLLSEPDAARRGRGLACAVDQSRRFLANAFESDGASLEGMGYWNYGLAQLMVFAEMMRAATGDKIDLLAEEKLAAIARFPLAVSIGPDLYASFSDDHEHSLVHAYIGVKLAERTGVAELLGLIKPAPDFRVQETLCDLMWWDGQAPERPAMSNIILAESGLARLVSAPVVVAVKAGHNGEPHNQNDVGSFIVCAGGEVYLCDPGAGLYSREYFSSTRYDNVFCNSYGHSVPRIGGALQATGTDARGVMESDGDGAVRVRFEEAYPDSGLREATRRIAVADGAVTLDDAFAFDGAGAEVEEAFITWRDVAIEGNTARISTEHGTLELTATQGEFQVERLDEACRQNRKPETLSRITVTYPAGQDITASFTMAFHPTK